IQFGNIQLNTKMSAELIAVDAGGEKNLSVVKTDMDALAAHTITVTASLPQDWPTDQYKLDVYLADKLVKSQPFSVQYHTALPSPPADSPILVCLTLDTCV